MRSNGGIPTGSRIGSAGRSGRRCPARRLPRPSRPRPARSGSSKAGDIIEAIRDARTTPRLVPGAMNSAPIESGTAVPLRLPDARVRMVSDFLTLTKPRVNLLVLVTTAIGFYLGSFGTVDIALLVHTVVGTALVAAGAAAFNQVLERDIDR